jgi:hypothetical protein
MTPEPEKGPQKHTKMPALSELRMAMVHSSDPIFIQSILSYLIRIKLFSFFLAFAALCDFSMSTSMAQ